MAAQRRANKTIFDAPQGLWNCIHAGQTRTEHLTNSITQLFKNHLAALNCL